MSKIKVMNVQIGWSLEKEDNLNRAKTLVEKGIEQYGKPDILLLPEFFYANPTRKNKQSIGEPINGLFFRTFSELAAKYEINILAGTFPQKKGEKLYNTALAIDREGNLIGEYSKVHLFDAFDHKESDVIDAGENLGIFDFDFGKAGVAICYELRFPEYLRTLALQDIDLLLVPAAFYRPRGEQWDLLVRAAALQNSIYVAAANQYNQYCFGRSQIVDPAGQVLMKAPDEEGVICAVIDTNYRKQVRDEFAVFENRVPALYYL